MIRSTIKHNICIISWLYQSRYIKPVFQHFSVKKSILFVTPNLPKQRRNDTHVIVLLEFKVYNRVNIEAGSVYTNKKLPTNYDTFNLQQAFLVLHETAEVIPRNVLQVSKNNEPNRRQVVIPS